MKKLLLLIALVGFGVMTVPELRLRAAPLLRPVLEPASGLVEPAMDALREPMLRWSAEGEARSIAYFVAERHRGRRPLPRPSEFDGFISKHYRNANQQVLIDPWGFKYFLIAGARDSVVIGSSGPDARRNTEDDVRVSVPRR